MTPAGERRELDVGPGVRRAGAPGKVTVTGACVDAVTSRPVKGCEVTLNWGRLEKVVTEADGRFRFEIQVDRAISFQLSIEPRTGMDLELSRDWHGVVPGTLVQLGSVKIHQGCRLTGVLLDHKHRPLGGVLIFLHNGELSGEWPAGFAPRGQHSTTTRRFPPRRSR